MVCVSPSERILNVPDLVDDCHLNLLDWGSSNVLAIALEVTEYLWDASNGSTSEVVMLEDKIDPITSVNWAPNGISLVEDTKINNIGSCAIEMLTFWWGTSNGL